MPVPNQAIASAGIIAVTVAVAAAIAIYESPELRRYADDLRRRIAVALHSLGDGINPNEGDPIFNRPEDADGFLQSRRGEGAEPGVDADEETRRRQREELMYWNALKREQDEKRAAESETRRMSSSRGSSFDDFLRQEHGAERGTYVFNTGADVHGEGEGLVRRRGAATEGLRGLNSSVIFASPFGDEHQIDNDEIPEMSANILSPGQDEIMSDIYSATTREAGPEEEQEQEHEVASTHQLSPPAQIDEVLSRISHLEVTPTLERELEDEEYMTAGQESREEAYASIQAWAQGSSPDFYSPLPMSPAAPMSEPELVSDGELTPTDSASLVGSGEDVANDTASYQDAETGRVYDVLSQSDGFETPASWSEVGSVVSDNEVPLHA